jgi:hypothetical protein
MMVAELWHDWFETMSHVAYQAHKTCEVLAETGAPPNGSYGPFSYGASRAESEMQNSSVDMDKLKECLQSMEPMQAARVMHAVQTMQAMEAMLKKRKARAAESEGTAW